MGLSGCMSCLKYLLFAFNFIFWLAGVAILGLAIYFRVDGATQNVLSSDTEKRELFYAVCYVLMAAGGAIMLVGFCGCCGAANESRLLLSLFAVALFVLLGTEIGAGVYTHFHKDKVIEAVDKGAVELWKGTAAGTNSTAVLVDEIEKDLDCCGYNNVLDYCNVEKIALGVIIGNSVTGTFECDDGSSKNPADFCPSITSYAVGCRQKIKELLEKNLNIVIGVAIGVAMVQLLGMIFSILLCQAIGQEYTAGKIA